VNSASETRTKKVLQHPHPAEADGSRLSRCRSDHYLAKSLRDAIARHTRIWGETKRFGRVVDFGCGTMPYANLIRPVCSDYIGCDLVGTGAAVEFKAGCQVPIDNASADRLVSFQVLEHVDDIAWYLKEARRMLAADGQLLLSTHGVWPYHPHPHDYRRWTREGLILDLERNGFEIEHVEALVGPGAWTLIFQSGAIALGMEKLGAVGRLAAAALNYIGSWILPLVDQMTPAKLRDTNASVYPVSARPRLI